jgi:hypothetical protein
MAAIEKTDNVKCWQGLCSESVNATFRKTVCKLFEKVNTEAVV